MAKVFSKEKWLQDAKAQIGSSSLTQKDIDNALDVWVNDLDGKTEEEIAQLQGGDASAYDAWLVDADGE